jgi:uncharacterized protein YqjF (DUF2071 family)
MHRPYPPPDSSHVMHQTWHDLLFMHWRVPAESLRQHLPTALPLDTFDDSAWIGIVPFRMSDVRPRFLPALPWLSAFPELNVRTYVTLDGRPGVWFFSLDAGNPLAVWIARAWFKLPYFTADMHIVHTGQGRIRYTSRRTHPGASPAEFAADYGPVGDVFDAQPGSLEYFLTARYCLYATDRHGRVLRAEIDHPAWPLQSAEAEVRCNSLTDWLGIRLPDDRPLLHFSRRIEMVAWALEPVGWPTR